MGFPAWVYHRNPFQPKIFNLTRTSKETPFWTHRFITIMSPNASKPFTKHHKTTNQNNYSISKYLKNACCKRPYLHPQTPALPISRSLIRPIPAAQRGPVWQRSKVRCAVRGQQVSHEALWPSDDLGTQQCLRAGGLSLLERCQLANWRFTFGA